jgi:hypothetical protein
MLAATLPSAASADDPLPGRDGNYTLEGAVIEGTKWSGQLGTNGPALVLRFERDGVVCYTILGANCRDLSWRQQGNLILMKANNGYSEFRLTIDGNRLRGQGHNKAGENWQLDMKLAGPISKEKLLITR